MNNKRGQEEIIGFVLVIVLVVIIGVVFLGISLRKPVESSERESALVYQFLDSSMEQSSSCALGSGRDTLRLDELISECFNSNNECVDGNKTCDVMNGTILGLLEGGWNYGPDSRVKGYEFDSSYVADSSGSETKEEILIINVGNCSGSKIGNSYFAPEFPGKIITVLEVCY